MTTARVLQAWAQIGRPIKPGGAPAYPTESRAEEILRRLPYGSLATVTVHQAAAWERLSQPKDASGRPVYPTAAEAARINSVVTPGPLPLDSVKRMVPRFYRYLVGKIPETRPEPVSEEPLTFEEAEVEQVIANLEEPGVSPTGFWSGKTGEDWATYLDPAGHITRYPGELDSPGASFMKQVGAYIDPTMLMVGLLAVGVVVFSRRR